MHACLVFITAGVVPACQILLIPAVDNGLVNAFFYSVRLKLALSLGTKHSGILAIITH